MMILWSLSSANRSYLVFIRLPLDTRIRYDLVYIHRDAKDILSKLTEHRGLTENPFERCTVFERNDFNHLVYPFFRTEDRMLRYKR